MQHVDRGGEFSAPNRTFIHSHWQSWSSCGSPVTRAESVTDVSPQNVTTSYAAYTIAGHLIVADMWRILRKRTEVRKYLSDIDFTTEEGQYHAANRLTGTGSESLPLHLKKILDQVIKR